ncbi:MAG: hypothetical protein M1820_003194 [Bogoriella megaspora]|nr:MAG: hypothetical protein M1820_003194 [Bogoriella megaspora]
MSFITHCVYFIDEPVVQETLAFGGSKDDQEEKGATEAPHPPNGPARKTPDIGRFLQICPLVTYSAKEGWNDVRFSVVKCLEDDSFWLVAQPSFYGEEDTFENETIDCYAEPHERTFLLDGFDDPISCARLKANEESFQFCAEMQKLHDPKRTHASKPFDIEQLHSGGFFLGPTKRKD